jgi:hypothetical protein
MMQNNQDPYDHIYETTSSYGCSLMVFGFLDLVQSNFITGQSILEFLPVIDSPKALFLDAYSIFAGLAFMMYGYDGVLEKKYSKNIQNEQIEAEVVPDLKVIKFDSKTIDNYVSPIRQELNW